MYPPTLPRFWKVSFLLPLIALMASLLMIPSSATADEDLVVGRVLWEPGLPDRVTNDWDRTDFWCAIGISPSTGKFAGCCGWSNQDNATRQAREYCNAADAKVMILCQNGWCALARGRNADGKSVLNHVAYAADEKSAEQQALDGIIRAKLADAKVVYSIYARASRAPGVIAYSKSTGRAAWAVGVDNVVIKAMKQCKAADAQIIAGRTDCWMALALGDDKAFYGVGWAGNRLDAEKAALADCAKKTNHARVAFSFSTTGSSY